MGVRDRLCACRVANGINTVHLSYVREKAGHALAGARQWIPAEDIKDPVKSLVTGLPPDLRFRAKGQLAIAVLAGAYADGLAFDFVCGDEVSAGKGSKGDRWYAWAGSPPPLQPFPAGPPPPEDRRVGLLLLLRPGRAATPHTTCENLRSARRGRPDARLYVRSRGPTCPQLSSDHASVERTMILKAAGTPVQRHAS